MAKKPKSRAVLSIGVDAKGKVVEIRVAGKKVTTKTNSKHKCGPGTKSVTLKLKFCKPTEGKASSGKPGTPKGNGPTPPCCMVAGGRLICWPPCV